MANASREREATIPTAKGKRDFGKDLKLRPLYTRGAQKFYHSVYLYCLNFSRNFAVSSDEKN